MHIFLSMKSKAIHIILLFALVLAFSTNVSAEESELSSHESAFLALINEARENPLAVAISMGMNPDRILKDFPELEDILTQGLSPLTFNMNLYEAARAHTEDMLEMGYYSHDSLDGRTYEERIAAAGYISVATGESLGLLGFSNFIDPDESVSAVFEKMFRDELDPSNTNQRNILNSELAHVGVAIGTGTLNVGADIFNVYLVTCDFGSSVEKAGFQLFQLINQARTRPLEVIESLGMDPARILEDLPELHDILTQGLPPLVFNMQLHAAAVEHVKDMFENDYYSHDSLDGRTYEERILETGYEPLYAGESMGLQCLGDGFIDENDNNMDSIVSNMFRQIFAAELSPDAEERNILDPLKREVGISIIKGTSSGLVGICGDNVLLMVADFGHSSAEQYSYIEGFVYSDPDQDMLYSPGEGIFQIAVSIEELSGDEVSSLSIIYTNEAGGFGIPAVPGEYRISVTADGYEMTKYIEIGEEEIADLVFRLPLLNEESDP